ncbi:MAG: hypothetical protein ACFFD4_07985 [Candidatus Odinarchaeota archaeon]
MTEQLTESEQIQKVFSMVVEAIDSLDKRVKVLEEKLGNGDE